ncbi:MAG: VCBS repeat-containing protein [Planctomycetota bacterium]
MADLNGDGYDDFAIAFQPASGNPYVNIYLGAANMPASLTAWRTISTSGISVTLTPTAGDFDGDGEMDFAILESIAPASGGTPTSGNTYLFWSIATKGQNLTLLDADVSIDSECNRRNRRSYRFDGHQRRSQK